MELTTTKQMVRCVFCRERYEDQFINQYETLEDEKDIIKVCEYCKEEKELFDDKMNMRYIETDNQDYYASSDL